jgi:glutathione peroxidase
LNQEPGTDEEILQFVRSKQANFRVFKKIDVNGKNACDLYKFLRLRSNLKGNQIGWNFGKFIVSRDGEKIEYFVPNKPPKKLVNEIEKFL